MGKKIMSLICMLLFTTGCSSIPSNIPNLINKTSNTIDHQAILSTNEWKASIATAKSSKMLLELIYGTLENIDKTTFTPEQKKSIEKFEKGYLIVLKQLNSIIEQQQEPEVTLENFEKLTNALRFANSYISKDIDEQERVNTVINGIIQLKKSVKGKNNE